MPTPEDILYQYWKFRQFKGLQKEAISSVLQGNDTCVFFPTGGGKSICFQIPAMLEDGICIVISPLISLMQDQVANLNNKGIKALHLKGGLSYVETDRIFDNLRNGNYKFLYLSPEKLQNTVLQERLKYIKVNMIAVDEAHCVSQWGHDFRPAYLDIAVLRDIHPDVPLMALTATATKRVQNDIVEQLKLNNSKFFKSSFKRSNITLLVNKTDNKWENLIDIAKSSKTSGIVYVRSRKFTLDLARLLNQNNITSKPFHGGLLNTERKKVLEQWLDNKISIVVATTAFGMGIDKPDVDLIVHIHLPENLESYYQEIGRAGRNGKPARAILMYNETDITRLKYQFLKYLPEAKALKKIYKHLMSYLQIAYGEGSGEDFGIDLNHFCSRYNLDVRYTFEMLKALDRFSIINFDQHYQINAKLKVLMPHQQLFEFLRKHKTYSELVTCILRNYAGVFDLIVNVDLEYLAKQIKIPQETIIRQLEALREMDIIDLKLMQQDLSLSVLQPREDDRSINVHNKSIKAYRNQKIGQVQAVINYIKNEKVCRQVQLLQYFDEADSEPCGKCSVCLENDNNTMNNGSNRVSLQNDILLRLKECPMASSDLLKSLNCSKPLLINALEKMLENRAIELTPNNLYKIRK